MPDALGGQLLVGAHFLRALKNFPVFSKEAFSSEE
jgi:hypothetical protein